MNNSTTLVIQNHLDKLLAGSRSTVVIDELLLADQKRREKYTRKKLRFSPGFPSVIRQEDTSEIVQDDFLDLREWLLTETPEKFPKNPKEYYIFSSRKILDWLIERLRKYNGPHGINANRVTLAGRSDETAQRILDPAADANYADETKQLELYESFLATVKKLPDDQREVFDLLWFQDLTQQEAAEILEVSEKTVARRWTMAKLVLSEIEGLILN